MPPTVATDIALPEDVVRYCNTHHLTEELQTAISIARESFAPVRKLTVEVEDDPEVDEQRILIFVASKSSVEDALQRKRDYTTRWIQAGSADARERIRLIFDIS